MDVIASQCRAEKLEKSAWAGDRFATHSLPAASSTISLFGRPYDMRRPARRCWPMAFLQARRPGRSPRSPHSVVTESDGRNQIELQPVRRIKCIQLWARGYEPFSFGMVARSPGKSPQQRRFCRLNAGRQQQDRSRPSWLGTCGLLGTGVSFSETSDASEYQRKRGHCSRFALGHAQTPHLLLVLLENPNAIHDPGGMLV